MSTTTEGDAYSTAVREFRHSLLSQQAGVDKHAGARQLLRQVFKSIDENGDGTLTDEELFEFTTKLGIPPEIAEILVQQIDINHDGKVTYSEMAEFLWPRVESRREIGIVIEVVREALIKAIGKKIVSKALKNDTAADDEKLLGAFAEKTKAVLIRGKLIDVRQLKRALHNLMDTSLGELSDYEIEMLAHSMDANDDSVVSAREFKAWLFLQKGYFRSESNISQASVESSGDFEISHETFDLAPGVEAVEPSSTSFGYDDVYPDAEETTTAIIATAAAELEEDRKRADTTGPSSTSFDYGDVYPETEEVEVADIAAKLAEEQLKKLEVETKARAEREAEERRIGYLSRQGKMPLY